MRVLVTGADGFVGRHLVRELRDGGDEVIAAPGPGPAPPAGEEPALDVLDPGAVAAIVAGSAPDAIVNLAGVSSVKKSHDDPRGALLVNAVGTLNVLAAIKAHAPRARVLVISSGEVYGATAGRAAEDAPVDPLSPYASSKLAAEVVARQFVRGYGLDVVIARSFNHVGPGQAESFVLPSFARQLAAMERGEQPLELAVGDLSKVRDFSHVLDVIAAYRLLLTSGLAGEVYNVCSGRGYAIEQLLDLLIAAARVKPVIQVDPARLRQGDEPALIGDPSKLQALGWRPGHSVEEAVAQVLAAARRAAS